jgi:hypothetical protein
MSKAYGVVLRSYFVIVSLVTLGAFLLGSYYLIARGLETFITRANNVPAYNLDDCDVYHSADLLTHYPGSRETDEAFDYRVQTAKDKDEANRKSCEDRNQETIDIYKRKRADALGEDLALMLIGLPLFLIHFRIVYKDWREEKKQTT